MPKIVKYGLILFAITAATGLILGGVYTMTLEPIRLVQEQEKNEALASTLPGATEFKAVEIKDGNPMITEIYEGSANGEIKGYNFTVTPKGYAGLITTVVGVNNEGRLCLKGLYGWDYLNDPQILTRRLRQPMIRKFGKDSPLIEVSWDEAIQFAAERLKAIIKSYGPDTVMGAGSARGPGNEAAYIMQKFMRAVVGTNNVDHCARV